MVFMALLNCIECNHVVSDKASACPGCGYPLDEGQRGDEGCLHPDPGHLHYCGHRDGGCGPGDDELLPLRPDGG